MSRKALIVWGGWEGHQPRQVAELFQSILSQEGFEVELSDTLDSFNDASKLMGLNLIIPHWTMGRITSEQCNAVMNAVARGVGLAGCHGGMCDAFRDNTDWQFMTGAQWVAHPGNDNTRYTVNIARNANNPIIKGINDFQVASEQYYLHVDPGVKVLATTRFPVADGPHAGNPCDMPVIYTKLWGQGRVYYNSLGHVAAVLDQEPVKTLVRRGFQWAAKP